jgi:23S rRNA (adenine2503-C2)-methyltransferase
MMDEKITPSREQIFSLNLKDLEARMAVLEEPKYRALQIWQGLYQQFWKEAEEFTNLPASLRKKLADNFIFSTLTPMDKLYSRDGETAKILFQLQDGKAVETVLMQYSERRTLCISTQAGCAMGCVFCATGQMGFHRHLTRGEIVEQVLFFSRILKQEGDRLTNIVIMGMGEPFHNYKNTLSTIDCLNDPLGFNFGERRFTISTVGLIPMIDRFAAEKRQVNLAISLHAANDELRTSLLPVNRKYPIKALMESCRNYIDVTGRRLTFEWALIQNVNDRVEDARELAHLIKGMLCHVNIIPLNPTQKYPGKATPHQRAEVFRSIMEQAGIPCTIRIRRGIDIQAGCGQLASHSEKGMS